MSDAVTDFDFKYNDKIYNFKKGFNAELLKNTESIDMLATAIYEFPDFFAEKEYFFEKRNDGECGIKDPGGNDSMIITTGKNVLETWKMFDLTDQTIEIWKLINSDKLINFCGQSDYNLYFKNKLLYYPLLNQQGNRTDTRYCGMTIGDIADKLEIKECINKSWQYKPEGFWIPSFYGVINEFSEYLDTIGEHKISQYFTEFITKTWEYMNNNYFLVLDMPMQISVLKMEEILWEEILKEKNVERRNKLFFGFLIVKSFYAERLLNGLGILHTHLHADNMTFEWVRKDIENIENIPYSPDNILFDFEEGLNNIEIFIPIIRIIDNQDTVFIEDWPLKLEL